MSIVPAFSSSPELKTGLLRQITRAGMTVFWIRHWMNGVLVDRFGAARSSAGRQIGLQTPVVGGGWLDGSVAEFGRADSAMARRFRHVAAPPSRRIAEASIDVRDVRRIRYAGRLPAVAGRHLRSALPSGMMRDY